MHLLHVLHLLLALILSTLAITVAATAPEQQQQRIIGPIHVWVELFDNANFRGASFQGMVVTKLCHGVGQRRGRISSYAVANGCCDFYAGDGCDPAQYLFSAKDRRDGRLRENDDRIGSFWCEQGACAGPR